jgi:hypothetical protein
MKLTSIFQIGTRTFRVDYETQPAKGEGRRTVDLDAMPDGAVRHSLSGYTHGGAGQIVDMLRNCAVKHGHADALRLADLWDAMHLNDMRPATRAQSAALGTVPAVRNYEESCKFLADAGLNPDNVTRPSKGAYKYGSAWLFEPISDSVAAELLALLARLNGDGTAEDPTPKARLHAFAKAHGVTVESVFVPFSKSRNKGEKSPSLNWRVTVKKAGRDVLSADYSAGCGHAPSYKAGRMTRDDSEVLRWECENGKAGRYQSWGVVARSSKAALLPDLADVLASFALDSSVLDFGAFEEWASDYGYDADSREAEKTYRACLETALRLRSGLGESTLAALRDIANEY